MNEEDGDSDSDFNPDIVDEVPTKRKRPPVARKSTTPGKKGIYKFQIIFLW